MSGKRKNIRDRRSAQPLAGPLAEPARGADILPQGLCSIFDDKDVSLFRHLKNRVHVGTLSKEMNRDDGFCSRCNLLVRFWKGRCYKCLRWISTKTGVAPTRETAPAVAKKVKGGTRTSSPGPIPRAIKERIRASDPDATPMAYGVLTVLGDGLFQSLDLRSHDELLSLEDFIQGGFDLPFNGSRTEPLNQKRELSWVIISPVETKIYGVQGKIKKMDSQGHVSRDIMRV